MVEADGHAGVGVGGADAIQGMSSLASTDTSTCQSATYWPS
jgi:hypothetical protein